MDDRGDNAVIGWCREAGTDLKYPLLFTQQLRVLQYFLKECTVFQKLDIGILKAKQLLSVDRIETAEMGESIYEGDALIVVWKGKIEVTNALESFEQNVDVPRAEVCVSRILASIRYLFQNSTSLSVHLVTRPTDRATHVASVCHWKASTKQVDRDPRLHVR